jgi:hypothetical protein
MRRTRHRPSTGHVARRLARAFASMALIASTLLAPTASPEPSTWAWPVADPHVVVRPWQAPADDYSAGHRGIDIDAPVGTVVVAPESGEVHFAGRVVDRSVVSIAHPGGLVSSYEPVETRLKKGDRVARGEPIGLVTAASSPSHCAPSCLHLGVRRDGRYLSPLILLENRPRAILLPVDSPGGLVDRLGDRAVDREGARMPRVTPEGAPGGRSAGAARSSRGCRSGSCRGSHARASPARHASRLRRRAGGWRPCA